MLILRPLRLEDEPTVSAAQEQLDADGFNFLIERDRRPTRCCSSSLTRTRSRLRATFLVAEVDGEMIGRLSIRHELCERLERGGGHVGFGVLPTHRRRGCATQVRRRSLAILAAEGLAIVLVTCDEDNMASANTIERCGGELVDCVEVDGALLRRYHVPTACRAAKRPPAVCFLR